MYLDVIFYFQCLSTGICVCQCYYLCRFHNVNFHGKAECALNSVNGTLQMTLAMPQDYYHKTVRLLNKTLEMSNFLFLLCYSEYAYHYV